MREHLLLIFYFFDYLIFFFTMFQTYRKVAKMVQELLYTLIQNHQLFSFCPICFIILSHVNIFKQVNFFLGGEDIKALIFRERKTVLSVSASWYDFDFNQACEAKKSQDWV